MKVRLEVYSRAMNSHKTMIFLRGGASFYIENGIAVIQIKKRIPPRNVLNEGAFANCLRAISLKQVYREKMGIDIILPKKSKKVYVNFLRSHVSFVVNPITSEKSGSSL